MSARTWITEASSRARGILRTAWELLYTTANGWLDAKAPRLGAALAFYTIFSLAPLLVIAVSVAGLLFGREAAQGQLTHQLISVLGEVPGKAVEAMLIGASKPASGILASIVGVVTLLIGSTGLFVELQESLNTIWGVPPRPGNTVWLLLRQRLLSFSFVLGMGFLLLLTLVTSAAVSAVTSFVNLLPYSAKLLQLGNLGVSFAVTTGLLAMMYKLLPDAEIAWRDVFVGALLTAALFTLGKYLIGLYLGLSSFSSTFGAAGSLVAILSWIYYSAQILLFGAEFTQVYAERYGSHVRACADLAQAGGAPASSSAATAPIGPGPERRPGQPLLPADSPAT